MLWPLAWLAGLVFTCGVASAATNGAVRKLGVGLYGGNGHQLALRKLMGHPHARLVAAAQIRATDLPASVRTYATLEELLEDPEVELISLCSPRRADQADDAIRCLEAGKHVYAEKPAALTEADLDRILAAAAKAGREFREMAGTAFTGNYGVMRQLVRDGAVGEVVQILVQKSYKYGQRRPQDEAIDGGLFLQAGIHAVRMIEHVGGVRIRALRGWQTQQGSPESGEGRMAASIQAELVNGGLATAIVNYLNPAKNAPHGNDTLRIFGTKGFVESVDGGVRSRLVSDADILEPLPAPASTRDYFDLLAAHLTAGRPMPLTSEEELHPLRLLLRARAALRTTEAPAR